jgi:hypothetical protein
LVKVKELQKLPLTVVAKRLDSDFEIMIQRFKSGNKILILRLQVSYLLFRHFHPKINKIGK